MKNRDTVFMNKICIFAKNPNTYFLKRLREVLGKRLEFFNPWGSDVLGKSYEKVLVRTTGVYGDDRDLKLLEGRPGIINNLASLKLFRSKDSQYRYFEKQSIPHLRWFNLSETSLDKGEEFLNSFPEEVEFLVKPLRGQGGWGIQVMTKGEFPFWWKTQSDKNDLSYLVQPYLKNARECRVFFIQNDFFVSLERTPTQSVAANFTQEGNAHLCETPLELKQIVHKLMADTGLVYGALDCLWDGSGWIILEVNVAPGIEQLEKVSGLDIIREFIKRLLTP